MPNSDEESDHQNEGSDVDVDDASSDQATEMTEGSFVKVGNGQPIDEDALDGIDISEPDVYDVNVVAWDTPVSPLHLAILGGHTETIKILVGTFGAEVLLPIKVVHIYYRTPKHAIMTLVLAAQLSGSTSLDVTKQLISLGASSAQGDMEQIAALHYLVAKRKLPLLKACFEDDGPAARSVLNHLSLQDAYWQPKFDTPLTTAIKSGDEELVYTLLDAGAKPSIDVDSFVVAYTQWKDNGRAYGWRGYDTGVAEIWKNYTFQPIFLALNNDMPSVIVKLLEAGADQNALDIEGNEAITHYEDNPRYAVAGGTLLDAVVAKICGLESAVNDPLVPPKPIVLEDDPAYLEASNPGSYEHWFLSKIVRVARNIVQQWQEERDNKLQQKEGRRGQQQRLDALRALRERFVNVRDQLLHMVCNLMTCCLPTNGFCPGAEDRRSLICQASSANTYFRAHSQCGSFIQKFIG